MKCLKTDTHALLVNISVTSNSEKQHLTKTKLMSLVLWFFFSVVKFINSASFRRLWCMLK